MNKNLIMKITAGLTAVFMSASCMLNSGYALNSISAEEYQVSEFIPGADEYRAIYVGDEDIIFPSAVSYNAAADLSLNDLWSKTSTDYGYNDLALRNKGEGRQKLYNAVDSVMKSFWNSTSNLSYTSISGEKAYIIKNINYSTYGLSAQDAIETYYIYKNDHPVAYYAANNIYYNDSYLILTSPEYYRNSTNRKAYNKSVTDYIDSYESLVDISSEYKTVLNFHDRMCDTLEYAYDSEGMPEQSAWAHDIIGATVVKAGVCETYARTFEMLLNYYDIENVFCAGDTGEDGHAWNLVKLDDGKFYYFDLTWDDFYNKPIPDYDYFAKGSRNFCRNHFALTPEGSLSEFLYALPEASVTDFVWTEPDAEEIPESEKDQSSFKNISVTLNDGIVINYFLNLSDSILSDSSAYIGFTSPSGVNRKINISEGVKDENGRYCFKVKLAPDQMADEITAQIYYRRGIKGNSLTYSVVKYAQVLKNTCDSETSELLDAMLNYGGAAQKYTGYNPDDTADRYAQTKSEESISISDEYITSTSGSVFGINIASATLVAGYLTSLRIKYDLRFGKISNFTFSYNGTKLEPVKEDGYYCIYIRDISPDDIDKIYSVSVSDKLGNTKVLNYSPFTYIKTILDNSDSYPQSLSDMMKALYYYNKAAEKYVASR